MPRERRQSFWRRGGGTEPAQTPPTPATSAQPPSADASSTSTSSSSASSPAGYTPDPRDDHDPLAPPPALREHAFRRAHETYDVRHAALATMRARIATLTHHDHHNPTCQTSNSSTLRPSISRPSIRIPRCDDSFLLAFLRCKKFRVEPAFVEFRNFCRAHSAHPWLRQPDISLVERMFSSSAFQVLPRGDRKRRLVLTMDLKVLSPLIDTEARERAQPFLAAIFALLETIMMDIRAQIFGVVVVSDLAGCRVRTFGAFSVQQYLLSLELCQHCYPLRASGMYLVHEPWFVRGLFGVMRPFMKPKTKENFRCFGDDISTIHDMIPQESLLPTYGGTLVVDEIADAKAWAQAAQAILT